MKKLLFVLCLGLLFLNISCTLTTDSMKKGTINLTVDTKNVTVESSDDATWYTASIKNSNDLQYLVITVKITDKEYIAKKCKLIVNDKEVSSKKITIDGNTITYKMDDPNWSDFI